VVLISHVLVVEAPVKAKSKETVSVGSVPKSMYTEKAKKNKKTFELNYIILIAWQDEFDILKTKHKIKTVKFCSNTAAVLKCLIKLSQLLHSVY
jgi:hypothetical protein